MEIAFEIELDDELVRKAQEYTGISDLSELITMALKTLIESGKVGQSFERGKS